MTTNPAQSEQELSGPLNPCQSCIPSPLGHYYSRNEGCATHPQVKPQEEKGLPMAHNNMLVGDRFTMAGSYKRRSLWQWLRKEPKKLQPYVVKRVSTALTEHDKDTTHADR